jgi:hypothetical protein
MKTAWVAWRLAVLASALAAPSPTVAIARQVLGSELVVRASGQSGIIESITWRGRELLSAYPGRGVQAASSFDGLGECLSPAEAGGRVNSIKAQQAAVDTTVTMGFRLAPGQASPDGCGTHKDVRVAQNRTALSGHLVSKRVSIGHGAVPNVIEYVVTFTVPEPHASAIFEAPTAYLRPEFSTYLAYDPGAGRAALLSDGPGEQGLPAILATVERDFAVGIYSPDLPQPAFPGLGYGRVRYNARPQEPEWNTVRWNCVFRNRGAIRGEFRYRCFITVGTVTEVRAAIDRLYREFH